MATRDPRAQGEPPPSPPPGAPEAGQLGQGIIPNPAMESGLFTTTSLIEGVRTRYAVPSLIRDTFFAGRDYVDAEVVQVDTYRGGRGLAPFVLPLEGQVIGRRRPFGRTFVEAPIIAPARVITLREATRPGWGETPYGFKTPEERVAEMYANDTTEMDDEISRTEEFMCAKCMITGKIPINYRNKTSLVIDYGFTNTTVLAKKWTDQTSNPLNDLQTAQNALNANGYSGNIAIYSPQAWAALWGNTNVQNLMKNLSGLTPISSYVLGQNLPAGVATAPSFSYPVMQNIIYSGTYVKAGAAVPYLPPDSVLIGSTNVKNRLIYSHVVQIEQEDGNFHSYLSDRVPKVECNVNKNFYMYTLTARPVPVPIDLLCWTVLTNAV